MKFLVICVFLFFVLSKGWIGFPERFSRITELRIQTKDVQLNQCLLLPVIPIIFSFFPSSVNCASNKFLNLPNDDIIKIVEKDNQQRQALNTADFTREIYDERCKFQDEIDIYPINEYIQGTKALFDPKLSHVELTSPVTIETEKDGRTFIKFRFKENLAFNFPFLKPIVSLSGGVELERDEQTGLIIYSRERWNESILDILKSVHLNSD